MARSNELVFAGIELPNIVRSIRYALYPLTTTINDDCIGIILDYTFRPFYTGEFDIVLSATKICHNLNYYDLIFGEYKPAPILYTLCDYQEFKPTAFNSKNKLNVLSNICMYMI